MPLVCENVYMYNHSAHLGMRFKFKLNYEQYTKDNERMHRRIGAEIREQYGAFDPLKLLDSVTRSYDLVRADHTKSGEVVDFYRQFLIYAYVNFLRMSSIWESPVDKFAAPGLHIIIADWHDKHLGYCAKALLVESEHKLTDNTVEAHILRALKVDSPTEAYKSYVAARDQSAETVAAP